MRAVAFWMERGGEGDLKIAQRRKGRERERGRQFGEMFKRT